MCVHRSAGFVWFPVNVLVIRAPLNLYGFSGETVTVEVHSRGTCCDRLHGGHENRGGFAVRGLAVLSGH